MLQRYFALSRFRGGGISNRFHPNVNPHAHVSNAVTLQNIQCATLGIPCPMENPTPFRGGYQRPSKAPNRRGIFLHHHLCIRIDVRV